MSQGGIISIIGDIGDPVTPPHGGTGVASPTAHTLPVAEGAAPFHFLGPLTNGQLLIGNTGNDPTPATITAGVGISISNAAGSITIANAIGTAWTPIVASQTLAVNNGYICSGGGALALLLPPVSAVGNIIEITLDGSASFTITQGAGQRIRIANNLSTLGAGGSLASTAQGDTVRMVCVIANLRWVVVSEMGNLTVN
jgi:hypothetical protein